MWPGIQGNNWRGNRNKVKQLEARIGLNNGFWAKNLAKQLGGGHGIELNNWLWGKNRAKQLAGTWNMINNCMGTRNKVNIVWGPNLR